jgi:pimeloyl-ACP methyl ester carboxylesterase
MGEGRQQKRRQTKAAGIEASTGGKPLRDSLPRQPFVSVRWLATTGTLSILAAGICLWGVLCLTFWQGGWQLLYHPSAIVSHTPAGAGLAFDKVGFAATDAGVPQMSGWWLPAASPARFTAIYLHGANGNLSDTVPALAALHEAGLNVFAFDYRGYGQSHFFHPSEANWREDAESSLQYLTGTRQVAPGSIVIVGRDLGANLALEVAAAHPELAGVVLDNPLASPTNAIFRDPRAQLVPARALDTDRWDLVAHAAGLDVPSLWFSWGTEAGASEVQVRAEAFQRVSKKKMMVWLTRADENQKRFVAALSRWLDDLHSGR